MVILNYWFVITHSPWTRDRGWVRVGLNDTKIIEPSWFNQQWLSSWDWIWPWYSISAIRQISVSKHPVHSVWLDFQSVYPELLFRWWNQEDQLNIDVSHESWLMVWWESTTVTGFYSENFYLLCIQWWLLIFVSKRLLSNMVRLKFVFSACWPKFWKKLNSESCSALQPSQFSFWFCPWVTLYDI